MVNFRFGPISSASEASLKAAINPNNTNYLYFVADKNGKLYFSKTVQEHDDMVNQLKAQGMWYQY